MIIWVTPQRKTLPGTSLRHLGKSFVSCSRLSALVSRNAQLNHRTITEFSVILGLQMSLNTTGCCLFSYNVYFHRRLTPQFCATNPPQLPKMMPVIRPLLSLFFLITRNKVISNIQSNF